MGHLALNQNVVKIAVKFLALLAVKFLALLVSKKKKKKKKFFKIISKIIFANWSL
jgi:hypothetical protein